MNALILGVGNILLGDEGVGIRVVEELENRYAFPEEIMVLDGGTAGIELLRYIEGRDLLIVIDAMRADLTPGTVFRVEDEDVPKRFMSRISPHQIGLSDLLAAGILTDQIPKRMILFGIEPESMTTGIVLSDSVNGSVDKIITAILAELDEAGYASPIPHPSPRPSRFWS
ncbi:MAG: HyaD/HybD family hydrogenase maturation endopeptidase [Proteobacteria bacterium]|nr:HyaD/HybD family hydrogenase maturation endopeptidase [Desulfobulbaceae bacterium]MBU4152611.1 HyaD/HybD family hydrogenase maturation endopeptidase [Pseudomonadota bacterium]